MPAADPVTSLPPPAELERRCMALALLDAVLCPDWESRYHSFDRHWDRDAGARMGSMRSGSGDDVFVLFLPDGTCAIKGFDHESSALRGGTVPGVLDGIPESFGSFTAEAAFSLDAASFVAWYVAGSWQRSRAVPAATVSIDGSAELLAALSSGPEGYAEWAADYFEVDVDSAAVARFFAQEPLTPALAAALSPDVDLDALHTDLEEIGYPSAL